MVGLAEAADDDVGDDLLRLVFASCHPVLSAESRVELTLRVCGATLMPDQCHPSRPIAVGMTRALDDQAVVYTGKTDETGHWQSAVEDLALWQKNDHCADVPVVSSLNGICKTNTQCEGGTQVVLCSPRGGHDFFHESGDGNPDNYKLTDTIWPFLKQFSLP